MIKKTIILFLAICFGANLYSQKKKLTAEIMLDSMYQIIETSTNDSAYLEAILIVAQIQTKRKPDTAILFINKGINESSKKKNLLYQGRFLTQKGIYFRYNKELDSSIFYYKLSNDKYLEIKDSGLLMSTVVNIANVQKAQGNYEEAVASFITAIHYYEKFDDERNKFNAIISKFNLGALYSSLKEYDKGIEIYEEIVNLPFVQARISIYAKTCINLSGQYSEIGKLDKAIYYAKEAEKHTESKSSLANLYNNLGNIYTQKKEYNSSIQYHKKALENANSIDRKAQIIESYNNLGNVNTKLKNYDKAEDYLLKSNELLLSGSAEMSSLVHNYEMLVALNEGQKDYEGAYLYSKELKKIQDSILGMDMKEAILDMETKYETEKITKEKELAEANELISTQKAENSQRRFIGAAICTAIVVLLLLYIFNQLKLIRKQKVELDIAYDKLEESKRYELAASNLKALKSQMNPHFIFNSLNSIQDLIMQEDKDKSYDYIVLFAELVRNTLTYSNNEFIPFDKEIDFLKVYLQLEKLRFGDEFKYSIDTDNITDIKVPSLIIQPFLENSLKHGLLHKEGLKELSLEFKLEQELTCVITDNGVGRTESNRIQERRGNKTHESFAMGAIKNRLDLLSERFDEKFSFEVEDLYEYDIAKGTRITVIIPFEDEF